MAAWARTVWVEPKPPTSPALRLQLHRCPQAGSWRPQLSSNANVSSCRVCRRRTRVAREFDNIGNVQRHPWLLGCELPAQGCTAPGCTRAGSANGKRHIKLTKHPPPLPLPRTASPDPGRGHDRTQKRRRRIAYSRPHRRDHATGGVEDEDEAEEQEHRATEPGCSLPESLARASASSRLQIPGADAESTSFGAEREGDERLGSRGPSGRPRLGSFWQDQILSRLTSQTGSERPENHTADLAAAQSFSLASKNFPAEGKDVTPQPPPGVYPLVDGRGRRHHLSPPVLTNQGPRGTWLPHDGKCPPR